MKKRIFIFCTSLLLTLAAFSQRDGNFQMHFIDVGQGDAALLVSPGGETVLFDNGVADHCDLVISYLDSIGVTSIDYFICSHYHDDHIGCTEEVFTKFPLRYLAYDRGSFIKTDIFKEYKEFLGTKRTSATVGQKLILDKDSNQKVIIEFVAMNGVGVKTTNENDLSLIALVHFGELDVLMGGDLSGINSGSYKDIESKVAEKIGKVEIYKVHHHGSKHSSNAFFLSIIQPKIGIISASGTIGRDHQHPTADCLKRLHSAGIFTYWTEIGSGVMPDKRWDKVCGSIKIEMEPKSEKFIICPTKGKVEIQNCY